MDIAIVLSHMLQVYRKSFKEFTVLRLVQRLTGHQGVVWTMKFSRNGKYLASGEHQDCLGCPVTNAVEAGALNGRQKSSCSDRHSGGALTQGGWCGGSAARRCGVDK